MAREIYQKGIKKKTTTMTRMIIRTRMVIIWHLSAGVGKKESVGRELFHFPFVLRASLMVQFVFKTYYKLPSLPNIVIKVFRESPGY